MKSKIKGQYRQGDVLIQAVSSVPESAKRQKHKGKVVLAEGEATGHAHAIHDKSAEWWKGDGEQFVTASKPVTHQEHRQIPQNKTPHRVRRQSEYSPAEIRSVAD